MTKKIKKYVQLKTNFNLIDILNSGELCEHWIRTLVEEIKPLYGLERRYCEYEVNEYLGTLDEGLREEAIEWLEKKGFASQKKDQADYYVEETNNTITIKASRSGNAPSDWVILRLNKLIKETQK